jgi:hypothetical protein
MKHYLKNNLPFIFPELVEILNMSKALFYSFYNNSALTLKSDTLSCFISNGHVQLLQMPQTTDADWQPYSYILDGTVPLQTKGVLEFQ